MRFRFTSICSAPEIQRPKALNRTWTANRLAMAGSLQAPTTGHNQPRSLRVGPSWRRSVGIAQCAIMIDAACIYVERLLMRPARMFGRRTRLLKIAVFARELLQNRAKAHAKRLTLAKLRPKAARTRADPGYVEPLLPSH